MSILRVSKAVDHAGLDELRRSRRDVVAERPAGDDTWEMIEGPFREYRRTLEVAPAGGDRFEVVELTTFSLAIPLWWPLILPLMKRALRSDDRTVRARWWWPKEIVSSDTARLVASLGVIGVMTGYLGVLIGQTITFATEDFGSGDGAQANTLAAVRVGVLVPLLILHRADRIGRRPLILGFATFAIVMTMVGSLSPNLLTLGATQTLARGITTGLITLLVLATTEEVPAGSRAFSISLITLCTALGAGMVVWFLPIADLFDGGWRVIYVIPGMYLPLLWWVGRHLPETRRFEVATDRGAPGEVNWSRFALIGVSAFTVALFASPASQLRNEFLRDDLGYTAAAISLFQLVISAPAGIAILISGIVADRFGRRWIAAIGLSSGVIMMALSYQLTGAPLWLAASAGIVLTGAAFPATRGYQTELFPTRARARVGGLLDGVGVAGSATGLIIVGYLSERWDDLGTAIGVMVFAPLLVAFAILAFFPETAAIELEVFNPDDPELDEVVPTESETPRSDTV